MHEGHNEAAAAERRRFGARYLSAAVIVSGAALLAVARTLEAGPLALGLSGIALALMAVGFFWGTFIYMKVVDEQERTASVWAAAAGMWVYFTLFPLRIVLEALNVGPWYGHEFIFLASTFTMIAVFLWRRFR